METLFSNATLFSETTLNTIHLPLGIWFDWLMIGLSGFGSEPAYMIVIPLLYWFYDRKVTTMVTAVFLISAMVNESLKYLYMHPRPDPALIDISFRALSERFMPVHSPGFPSGHANMALAFWGSLALLIRQRGLAIIALLIISGISYSRLFLGVHFLGDVVGGLATAACIILLVLPLIASIREWMYNYHIISCILLLFITISCSFILPGKHAATSMGYLAGFFTFDILCREKCSYNYQSTMLLLLKRALVGIPGLITIRIIYSFTPAGFIPSYSLFFLMGAWTTGIVPFLFHSWLIPTTNTQT